MSPPLAHNIATLQPPVLFYPLRCGIKTNLDPIQTPNRLSNLGPPHKFSPRALRNLRDCNY